ncbi:SsrA-binding protein [Thermosipho africanus H17ap60334]|jgi:SsrA-binding protein|uniref:SsrA-binding protein n=1 Tax=Thermosipho africanus (strain TCF52B) TaxID=484019 RepID=SSRP_THEAB|nr:MULTISPECIES: SsrA-binding protein SmpB [Thermosipho]B7IFV5.1 RecName: Full=SsrA-binding protein; AltName: Full=Small protein B [Thermosipho africanus TCF52B]HCF38669.1 SsrA-binding protein [Thermosipho africanus]ACJ74969.1 SsrA-binding protein [Thermosipho africanus TCF52B]EKF48701.1 SsrA-binding protein [Thermosipho africanus H17ap60334]MBZ4650603.1 smpB [Thermosipho sp. (in: thermotogales)]MDK2838981.1 SsrA-binding protein [Thermosipho sp. (in: thermotogales)]
MKVIATNKKAYSDYNILETYEAGIELRGTEVKALRESGANFKDSFCRIKNGEVFLLNLNIPQYRNGNLNNHDPERPRRLLLHKKEIHRLIGKVKEQGLTIIPTKIYFNSRGLVKVEIAVAKGKKKYDKREDIKKREINRKINEYLKRNR